MSITATETSSEHRIEASNSRTEPGPGPPPVWSSPAVARPRARHELAQQRADALVAVITGPGMETEPGVQAGTAVRRGPGV